MDLRADRQGAVALGPTAQAASVPVWLVALTVLLAGAAIALGGLVVSAVRSGATAGGGTLIERLSEAAEASPQDAAAQVALAWGYQQEHDYDRALEAYERALRLEPGDVTALYNRGLVLAETGREEEGERSLRLALSVKPTHTLAAHELGALLLERREYADAAEVLGPACDASPQTADLQAMLGFALERSGRGEEAVERYRAALRCSPDESIALLGLQRLGVEP